MQYPKIGLQEKTPGTSLHTVSLYCMLTKYILFQSSVLKKESNIYDSLIKATSQIALPFHRFYITLLKSKLTRNNGPR